MLNFVLDFLFPPVCVICGKLNENWACEKCRKRIEKLEKVMMLENNNNFKNFNKLVYIFEYDKIIRKLILQYKFFDKAYINNFFSKIILKNKKLCGIFKFYDIIIPVPMSIKKKKKRGYNQTELIAKNISKDLNIDLSLDNLKKIKDTETQSKLNEKERRNNIKNAFIVNNKLKIKNKRIILFDDIYTTGATVNECSRVLEKAGAKEILVLVIAKD